MENQEGPFNIISTHRFLHGTRLALSLTEGASASGAQVCSNFVFVSLGVARRHGILDTSALGNVAVVEVQNSKVMVTRQVCIVTVLSLRGQFWWLEQPATSVLERHPQFCWLCERFIIYKVHIKMRDFQAP